MTTMMDLRSTHLPFILCLFCSLLALNFVPRFLTLRSSSHGPQGVLQKRALSADIYVLQDVFEGDTFFECVELSHLFKWKRLSNAIYSNFDFFDFTDPTQ